MASYFTLSVTGQSDTGLKRQHNEDFIGWDSERGLALLADGMGGHRAGDVASRLSVQRLNEILLPALDKPLRLRPNKGVSRHATLVRRAINKANSLVFETAASRDGCQGMGTTLVLALLYDERVIIAHAGDSRAYRLRDTQLECLTTDHSLVQELLDNGTIGPEEAQDNPYSSLITRALGVKPKLTAEIQEFEARQGDVYLLCSDGLTDLVDDGMIQQALMAAREDWPLAARELVQQANRHGGSDNVSVILASLGPRRINPG